MKDKRECENGHKMTGIGFDDCCPECEAPWKDIKLRYIDICLTQKFTQIHNSAIEQAVESIKEAPIPDEWDKKTIDEAQDYFSTILRESKL